MLSPASVQKFFAIMEPKPHDKFNKKRNISGCPAGRLWKNTEDGWLLTQSSLSPGRHSVFFQRIHHEKILQPDMPDRRVEKSTPSLVIMILLLELSSLLTIANSLAYVLSSAMLYAACIRYSFLPFLARKSISRLSYRNTDSSYPCISIRCI